MHRIANEQIDLAPGKLIAWLAAVVSGAIGISACAVPVQDGIEPPEEQVAISTSELTTNTNNLACILLRRNASVVGNLQFGHVGWLFQSGATFHIGSKENLTGGPVVAPSPTVLTLTNAHLNASTRKPFYRVGMTIGAAEAWHWSTTSLREAMTVITQLGYDEIKCQNVSSPNAANALAVAAAEQKSGYTLTRGTGPGGALLPGNCLDHAYDVLRAYGFAWLPPPSLIITPTAWYNTVFISVQAEPLHLTTCSTWDRNLTACNAHGHGPEQDCAYYLTWNVCRARGTSNYEASKYTNTTLPPSGVLPPTSCTTLTTVAACDSWGFQPTIKGVDCAWYSNSAANQGTNRGICMARGSSNCEAGISGACRVPLMLGGP
jgi:hypothetical protein